MSSDPPSQLPNPLRAVHEQAGAEFQPYAQLEVVTTFGEPQAEYAAIRKGCGLIDLPQRGVLELSGRDRLAFLNNLLTNQTWDRSSKTGLSPQRGVYAFYLNAKGRIVVDMNVLEVPDGRTFLEIDARMVPTVRSAFEKYLFVEQVKMTQRVGALHEIALLGPRAREVLNQITSSPVDDLPPLGSAVAKVFDTDAVVFRDDPAGVPGFFLVFDATAARTVWMNLVSRFGERRALRPVGWAAFNATRVEAGRPLFDVDFGNSADPDQSVLPAEVGPREFERAVSLTKGCYLGQEIVARMHARGQQVAKQLVGLRLDDDSLPMAGAPLTDDKHNQVGVVTSSTISPVLSNAAIALGYVKKPLFAEGTILNVPAEGQMRRVTVVKTPFLLA